VAVFVPLLVSVRISKTNQSTSAYKPELEKILKKQNFFSKSFQALVSKRL